MVPVLGPSPPNVSTPPPLFANTAILFTPLSSDIPVIVSSIARGSQAELSKLLVTAAVVACPAPEFASVGTPFASTPFKKAPFPSKLAAEKLPAPSAASKQPSSSLSVSKGLINPSLSGSQSTNKLKT